MTLIEVIAVLTVLGVVTAIVVPSLVIPPVETVGFGQVVRIGRGAAVARAQTLHLGIDGDGVWRLRDGGEQTVAKGSAPGLPMVNIAFAPSGACLVTSPLPGEWSGWDVARCRPEVRLP